MTQAVQAYSYAGRLRFESFSVCGGVYARLDVQELDGDVLDRGTTNVDVNGPLREALARVGGRDPAPPGRRARRADRHHARRRGRGEEGAAAVAVAARVRLRCR
ncbi:hypothetical protein [Nonomuraea basaltis]|uniref:hypothetical protein n=1 Tax=Nonomuraea basaltis TaxID=2495887 RepID=UPI001F0D2B45|nr:hypothetical protein [Nonomuraea basaltis]